MRLLAVIAAIALAGCASIPPTSTECVKFTFDDGPNDLYTEKVLTIIKEKNISATFFLIGNQISTHKEIVKKIAAGNYALGNHTWSHPHLTQIPASDVEAEFKKTSNAIYEVVGVYPKVWRPPYEEWNVNIEKEGTKQGMKLVLWNYGTDAEEWKANSSDDIRDKIITNAKPGDTILMHDTYPNTVAALPMVIDGLRNKGLCIE
jgi:peptidoglycan/xylan/chitin deacetylase (PgdA/CDA1 family)